jgi:microsomal dipeptidase-like Zn-dependent dipeptidase
MGAWRWCLAIVVGSGALLAIHACKTIATPSTPAIPSPQPPSITGTLTQASGKVWGVADLHAHPASHLAFGGLNGQTGLIWGDPAFGTQLQYVPGGDLPDIPACDPETHQADVSDEISRFARGLVFQNLTKVTNLAHASHGGPTSDGEPPYTSWPNGRDILHQQMNVQSIRRAYEGGLRLMLASTVESQVIAYAMHMTIFPPPFSASRATERTSAEAQLQYIQALANANSDWMEIASTPEQAQSAIANNRLALILAIENDGLLLSDIQDLVQLYGVGAVIPVHLVNNDVGGTAAYEDLFNSATALEGSMFGYPDQFITVEPDPSLSFHFGSPQTLTSLQVAYSIGNVSEDVVKSLGYTQYPLCCPPWQGVPANVGERNSVGLRQPQTIQALMAMGLLVDMAHMGFHSMADTIQLAQATCNYPLVDTHTDFHTNGGDERSIYLENASYVASSQGVLGFGSSGSTQDGTTIVAARGAPLASFGGGSSTPLVVVFPGTLPGYVRDYQTDTSGSVNLQVSTSNGPPEGAYLYAQISFTDNTQTNTPLRNPGGNTGISLGNHRVADITSINLGVIDPSSCGGGDVTIDTVTMTTPANTKPVIVGHGSFGYQAPNQADAPIATLSGGSFPIYAAPSPSCPDPAEAFLAPVTAENQPVEHLQVQMVSGTKSLQSASALIFGAKVKASLCAYPDCHDQNACTSPQFTMTSAGGWNSGFELDAYVPVQRSSEPSIQAISICLTEPDVTQEPWEIDQVTVNRVVDPTRLWAGNYARWQQSVFPGRPGAIALGTDINGLQYQFPFADFTPSYADDGATCGATTGDADVAPAQYGDDTTGGTFTLHRPLRIGKTPLCLPDRGLATYGMLPEFFAAVYHYSHDAYESLFGSAQATIDAWKASRSAAARFVTEPDSCSPADAGPVTTVPSCTASDDGGADADTTIPESGLCGH